MTRDDILNRLSKEVFAKHFNQLEKMNDRANILQTALDETLEQINKNDFIPDVSENLFEKEITKLALERYPITMGSMGDEQDWDTNAQYRDCWIEGYKDFLNSR